MNERNGLLRKMLLDLASAMVSHRVLSVPRKREIEINSNRNWPRESEKKWPQSRMLMFFFSYYFSPFLLKGAVKTSTSLVHSEDWSVPINIVSIFSQPSNKLLEIVKKKYEQGRHHGHFPATFQ